MKHYLIQGVMIAALLAGMSRATAAPTTGEQRLDPRAVEVAKAMSGFLAGLKTFRFQTEETVDGAVETVVGPVKVQYSITRKVTGKRPDKLFIDVSGDIGRRKSWLRASEITALDVAEGCWTSIAVSSTPAGTIRKVRDEMGMISPLATLLYRDLGQSLVENADVALYLGEHYVGAELCDHLIFRAGGYNWQLWIQKGERPLPLKFVVTEVAEPSQPQQIVNITNWEIDPQVDESVFEPQIPEGAARVEALAPLFWMPVATAEAVRP